MVTHRSSNRMMCNSLVMPPSNTCRCKICDMIMSCDIGHDIHVLGGLWGSGSSHNVNSQHTLVLVWESSCSKHLAIEPLSHFTTIWVLAVVLKLLGLVAAVCLLIDNCDQELAFATRHYLEHSSQNLNWLIGHVALLATYSHNCFKVKLQQLETMLLAVTCTAADATWLTGVCEVCLGRIMRQVPTAGFMCLYSPCNLAVVMHYQSMPHCNCHVPCIGWRANHQCKIGYKQHCPACSEPRLRMYES